VYALYLDEFEKNQIEFKLNTTSNKLKYFKAVHGEKELQKEFEIHLNRDYSEIKKDGFYKKYNIDKYIEYSKNRIKSHKLKINSLGHIYSFKQILKDSIKNNYNKIIIIEYDFYFHRDIEERLNSIINVIQKSDVFYLGSSWITQKNLNKETFTCYKINNDCGTFGIVIDKNIFKFLLKILEYNLTPTDVSFLYFKDKFNLNCCYPNLVICDLCNSNICKGRDQLIYSNRFKWDLEEYDIKSKYIFNNLKVNNNYKITLDLNYKHKLRQGYIRIMNNNYPKTYLPKIKEKTTIINIFIENTNLEIELYNLFINNVNIELITT